MLSDLERTFAHTDEQETILAAIEGRALDDVILVEAGAGTGKTALLRETARRLARNGERVLYLTFSKATQESARPLFGGATDVKTVNGLAYEHMQVARLERRIGNLAPRAVVEALALPRRAGGMGQAALTRAILGAFGRFLHSDRERPDATCLGRALAADATLAEKVIDGAARLFELTRPGAATTLPLPHDVYLKAWQLEGAPGIEDYSLVASDESQDANPVTIKVLRNAMSLLLVGDPHQSIYGFRGAVDAMQAFDGARFALSLSFRFGEAVAALANRITAQKGPGRGSVLHGFPTLDTRIERIGVGQRHTRIYRTNAELLWDATFLAERDIPIAIIGDHRDMGDRLQAAMDLRRGVARARLRHPAVASYASWDELREAVANGHERELAQVTQLVERHGKSCRQILELLRKPQHPDAAQVQLVSAHRAKGLEWSETVVCDDFDDVFDGVSAAARDEEVNLQYVAATRCLRTLELKSAHLAQLHAA